MSQIHCSYILFFAFSWKVYRDDSGCCWLVCALGLNTFTSKNGRCCGQPQNLFTLMPTLAPSCTVVLANLICSPSSGVSSGSMHTSEHTSASKLAVRSLISLCFIVGNAPLGQLIVCMVNGKGLFAVTLGWEMMGHSSISEVYCISECTFMECKAMCLNWKGGQPVRCSLFASQLLRSL